jgi:DNA-binding NtrC family response regulator
MPRILIFDAYPSIRELLAEELAADGNTVVPIGNPESIAGLVTVFGPDLLILDPYIRGRMNWELFDEAKEQNPDLPVLLFTQWSSPDPHFGLAVACLPKSYILDTLKQKIKEILKKPSREQALGMTSARKTFLNPANLSKEV